MACGTEAAVAAACSFHKAAERLFRSTSGVGFLFLTKRACFFLERVKICLFSGFI
jgi:hypothetical protein